MLLSNKISKAPSFSPPAAKSDWCFVPQQFKGEAGCLTGWFCLPTTDSLLTKTKTDSERGYGERFRSESVLVYFSSPSLVMMQMVARTVLNLQLEEIKRIKVEK